jgi:hypothetical protein
MEDRILREAKKRAAERDMSLTAFIEEAVEDKLNKDRSCRGEPLHFELITFRGEGTYPEVDLDSGAELLDLMEE